jgi:hypothetical protein
MPTNYHIHSINSCKAVEISVVSNVCQEHNLVDTLGLQLGNASFSGGLFFTNSRAFVRKGRLFRRCLCGNAADAKEFSVRQGLDQEWLD